MQHLDLDTPPARPGTPFAQNLARATDGDGRDRDARARGERECPAMKARDAGLRVERAFREERDGVALLEGAQDPARVAAALVAVLALDEMVAEPVQQGADAAAGGRPPS